MNNPIGEQQITEISSTSQHIVNILPLNDFQKHNGRIPPSLSSLKMVIALLFL